MFRRGPHFPKNGVDRPARNAWRNLRPDDTVEVNVDTRWKKMRINEALQLKSQGTTEFRCPDCAQPVRLHGVSSTGARAHFEHEKADPRCRGKPSKGPARDSV